MDHYTDGPDRVFAFDATGAFLTHKDFWRDVTKAIIILPDEPIINNCENLYYFAVVLMATLHKGRHVILWPDNEPLSDKYLNTKVITDEDIKELSRGTDKVCPPMLPIPDNQLAIVGHTGGSTGTPKPQPKTWGEIKECTKAHAHVMHEYMDNGVVLTTSLKHLFGVLSGPLFALSAGYIFTNRCVSAESIRRGLRALPGVRSLVTTTSHLEALVRSNKKFPELECIYVGAAPLPQELAKEAEIKFNCAVIELLGAMEILGYGYRRTAVTDIWNTYPHVKLEPQKDGTKIVGKGDWLKRDVCISDHIELLPENQFVFLGRSDDSVKVHGNRQSLSGLVSKIESIPEVKSAALVQPEYDKKLVGFVVLHDTTQAPYVTHRIANTLGSTFTPRPLHFIDSIPADLSGKTTKKILLNLALDKPEPAR